MIYLAATDEELDKFKHYRKTWARLENHQHKPLRKFAQKSTKATTLCIDYFEGRRSDYKFWPIELREFVDSALAYAFDNVDNLWIKDEALYR